MVIHYFEEDLKDKQKTTCPCDSVPHPWCNNAEGCPCADYEEWLKQNGLD